MTARIALEHKQLTSVRTIWKYDSINSIDSLVDSIVRSSQVYSEEEVQNKFKGDTFEIFVEFFLKKMGGSAQVPIVNYRPAQEIEDYGVDGEGYSIRGERMVVQAKFRSNADDLIIYDEIAKTFMQGYHHYKLQSEKQILVVSTSYGFNQHAKKNAPGAEDINLHRDRLNTIIGLINAPFWKEFRDSIENSQQLGVREVKIRKPHQVRMNNKVAGFLASDNLRGWGGCGTGGGKTLVINDAAESWFNTGGRIVMIASPRIALTEQLKQELHSNKTMDYERITFHSGGQEELVFFQEDKVTDTKTSTTQLSKVLDLLNAKKPTIIFTTYHSSKKLLDGLHEKNYSKYLYLADECHNLVTAEFSEILDCIRDKFIGFTATSRETRDVNDYGMNNVTRWGRQIFNINSAELIQAGMTLPPRVYFAEVNDSGNKQEFEVDIVDRTVRKFKDEVCKDSDCKIIVTCSSVEVAHLMIEEGILAQLDDFEKFVVTSDTKRMGVKTKKGELERFKKAKNALIFHYDMLGEGIDVPAVTAVMPLRSLNKIKIVQNVGRAGRVGLSDRMALQEGRIDIESREKWLKPYAYIICPWIRSDVTSSAAYRNIMHVLAELRSSNNDFVFDDYVQFDEALGKKKGKDLPEYGEEEKLKALIAKDLQHFLEDQEKADAVLRTRKVRELVEAEYKLPSEDYVWLKSQPDPWSDFI